MWEIARVGEYSVQAHPILCVAGLLFALGFVWLCVGKRNSDSYP